MCAHGWHVRLALLSYLWMSVCFSHTDAGAQSSLKKVRIGVSETHVGYLPLQVAFHKGYYKDEGIDLEIVLMPTNVINTAALTGQIDINGAVTGTVGAAVQGSPMKLLIVTVGKPLLFLVSRKEIKDPRELRGKKIAGSSPGGTATVLAKQALSHYGIDPEKDEAVTWIRRGMRDQKVDHPSKLKPRRLYGSFGWNIMEPFKPGPDDVVIDKRRPSMFIGNEFETIMHNRGATTVVMIGCTTDGGVEMTVRDGHNRGHLMVIARDCVGTYTEEGHNAALKRIERFADVVDSKELIDIWRR